MIKSLYPISPKHDESAWIAVTISHLVDYTGEGRSLTVLGSLSGKCPVRKAEHKALTQKATGTLHNLTGCYETWGMEKLGKIRLPGGWKRASWAEWHFSGTLDGIGRTAEPASSCLNKSPFSAFCPELAFTQSLFTILGHRYFLVPNITGLISSRLSAGEGNGTLLQYSCLEKSMDGEAW